MARPKGQSCRSFGYLPAFNNRCHGSHRHHAQKLMMHQKNKNDSQAGIDADIFGSPLHEADIASKEMLYTEGADNDSADALFDLKSHRKE